MTNLIRNIIALVVFAAIVAGGGFYLGYRAAKKADANAIRQRDGKLNELEQELLRKDESIGKLNSEIATQDKLIEELKGTNAIWAKYADEKDLQIDSLTNLVATLKGQASGHHDVVTIEGKTSIDWWDKYKRFHLKIPDINKDVSLFEYEQRFAIDMVIFRQKDKDGKLKVQTAMLRELDKNGNPIPESESKVTLDLDRSSFKFDIPIDNAKDDGYKQKFSLGISHLGEFSVGYQPLHYKQFWFGAYGGYGDGHVFVGLGSMYYPEIRGFSSNVGIGAAIGYGSKRDGVTARIYVIVDIAGRR